MEKRIDMSNIHAAASLASLSLLPCAAVIHNSSNANSTLPAAGGDVDWMGMQLSKQAESLQCSASDLELCLGLGLSMPASDALASETMMPRSNNPCAATHDPDVDGSRSARPVASLSTWQGGSEGNDDDGASSCEHDHSYSKKSNARCLPLHAFFSQDESLTEDLLPLSLLCNQTRGYLVDDKSAANNDVNPFESASVNESLINDESGEQDATALFNSSEDLKWAPDTSLHSIDGDLDFDNHSLQFSPIRSFNSSLINPLSSYISENSSNSTSSLGLMKQKPVTANKSNYFLTFQDLQQSSLSLKDPPNSSLSKSGASSLGGLLNSRHQNHIKMDDSGTVCSSDASSSHVSVSSPEINRDAISRDGSVNSGKLKCWTDVVDDYDGADAGDAAHVHHEELRDESIIASLGIDHKEPRRLRSSSSPKTPSTPSTDQTSSSRSDNNLTSGYSSSSMTVSGTGNTGGGCHRPQLLKPTHRIRQSPSLPLNVITSAQHSVEVTSHGNLQKTTKPMNFLPRSQNSAPDLTFLSSGSIFSHGPTDKGKKAVIVQRPLSCPDTNLPFKVNAVDDWESLRVLLPKQFQRVFQGSSAATTPAIQEEPVPRQKRLLSSRKNSTDSDVCATCFKVQKTSCGNLATLAQSACDCTCDSVFPPGDEQVIIEPADDDDQTDSSNSSSLYFSHPPLNMSRSRIQTSPRIAQPSVSDLMEFSKYPDRIPLQLIINLKQKQELATCVKAAAMGLIGFREMRKTHSDNLSHVINAQFTSALHQLLEDGLKAGKTVWSALVRHCSPALYREHLVSLIQSDPSLTTDQERFHAFVKELLRLSDLSAWLVQTIQQDSSFLRSCYAMDGFVFLASSVTKDLWDDLMDTLAFLAFPSTGGGAGPTPATAVPSTRRTSTTAPRPATVVASGSNSVKRLATKLGRQISLLPSYSNLKNQRKESPAPPPAQTLIQPEPACGAQQNVSILAQLFPQPHLRMPSRWSDCQLSKHTSRLPPPGSVFKSPCAQTSGKQKVPTVPLQPGQSQIPSRTRKSPSMMDIRTFLS